MIENIRFDSFTLPKVSKTKEGYLRGKAIATRVGVFTYLNHDGTTRKELRHPDEVFKIDSLASLNMIPITDDHPPVFVNAMNATQFSAGYTGENQEILENKNIAVSLTVTHHSLIEKIMRGEKPEISLAYSADLIPENGNYDGEDYEFRQTNIRYNHLASVNRGRAGKVARFHFDGELANVTILHNINFNEVQQMSENNFDFKDLQSKLDVANATSGEKNAKIALLKSELQQEELKLDSMEKANAILNKQIEDLKLKTDSKVIGQMVMDRVALLGLASQYIDSTAYLYHSDKDIMIAAINKKQKTNENFDGFDEGYIKGRFDALMNATITNNVNPNIFHVISHHVDNVDRITNNDTLINKHIASQNKK